MMMAAVPPVATDMIMLTAMMEGTAWYGKLTSVDPELYSVLAPRGWGEGGEPTGWYYWNHLQKSSLTLNTLCGTTVECKPTKVKLSAMYCPIDKL